MVATLGTLNHGSVQASHEAHPEPLDPIQNDGIFLKRGLRVLPPRGTGSWGWEYRGDILPLGSFPEVWNFITSVQVISTWRESCLYGKLLYVELYVIPDVSANGTHSEGMGGLGRGA